MADAEPPGKMVVAGARGAQGLVMAPCRLVAAGAVRRHVHDAFEHRGNARAGEPVVTVTALRHDADQLRRRELAEVAARGLRRHVGRVGKLGRGQGAAVEQRTEDIGARRIADEGGDGGEIEDFAHV